MAEPETILLPRARKPSSGGTRLELSSAPSQPTALPQDLISAAVRRLQVLALLYAFVFFMAGLFPGLFATALGVRDVFARAGYWVPSVVAILTSLGVAALARSRRIPEPTRLAIGLLFEVVGSYGIAFAEYLNVTAPIRMRDMATAGFGLSWVAPWILTFTIAVPTTPARALAAATASASAVPVTLGLLMRFDVVPIALPPVQFFFAVVFPYALVVLMAFIGGRIVYGLGAEVHRARAMGSYHLVELLGTGGMGEVWRARHRLLARPAAIKLVRPSAIGGGDPEQARVMIKRFEREAQATASLRSAHTLELYDFGTTKDGTFYYVAELLEGYDLRTLVERFHPIPPERAVYLMLQVCDSLAEAHDAGIVHRDVKPSNIFTCLYGREADYVKVLDFGLVKLPESGGEKLHLTAENTTSGTPAFMSPEQILGAPLDGRADLYAAGCVLYWLLTSRLVFPGDNAVQVLVHHAQTPPTPPSAAIESPIPARLDALVLRCLAKDPAGRPATADELAAELRAVRAELEPWTRQRARAWWEEHHPAGDRVA